jgi:hypothetical protein
MAHDAITRNSSIKKSPVFYETGTFVNVFTIISNWSSHGQKNPAYAHTTFSLKFTLLSSHLRVGFQSGLCPSGFFTKMLINFLPIPWSSLQIIDLIKKVIKYRLLLEEIAYWSLPPCGSCFLRYIAIEYPCSLCNTIVPIRHHAHLCNLTLTLI